MRIFRVYEYMRFWHLQIYCCGVQSAITIYIAVFILFFPKPLIVSIGSCNLLWKESKKYNRLIFFFDFFFIVHLQKVNLPCTQKMLIVSFVLYVYFCFVFVFLSGYSHTNQLILLQKYTLIIIKIIFFFYLIFIMYINQHWYRQIFSTQIIQFILNVYIQTEIKMNMC